MNHARNTTRLRLLLFLFLLPWLAPVGAQTIHYVDTGEEFVGPFPSWKNIQTEYGAKGDGITDDTAAIQKALDELKAVQTNAWCVLYFPKGVYRITDTLLTARAVHHDYCGSNLIGADPATTILRWDGPANKPMLRYDSWYCKVSRLTFDGNGKAGGGLVHAGHFSTYCEMSDLVFQDIPGIGMNLGDAGPYGQAEHAVLRCKFLRCVEGIATIEWNTLDIYVWYCLFEDCGKAVSNHMGGYQAYENVFLRSTQYDLGSTNGLCLAVVNNTSIGSKTFISRAGNYVRGNKVYAMTDTQAISPAWPAAPLVLLDNLFAGKAGASGRVVCCAPSTLAVGNTFSIADWPLRPLPSPHPNAATLQRDMPKAFDNNPATEFYDPGCNNTHDTSHPLSPLVLQWNGAHELSRKVMAYTLTSGSQPAQDPRDFRLLGSNFAGGPWTVLDTQTNVTFARRGEKQTFPINTPLAFTVYRFEATANAGGTSSMRVGKFALLDGKGADLTQDKFCLMTTRNEAWGDYYELDTKIVAPETLPVPATVTLPGVLKNRHRTIFEMHPGTGDDAGELQKQIDSAAKAPLGSKPVVHVPKGDFKLKRTVVIPARCDLQLIGDGVGCGSTLNYAGGDGPMLRLLGPNRATLRDLQINGGNQRGVEGMVIEQADQDGGRVYANQLSVHGAGGAHMVDKAIFIAGLERSDVTMLCGGFGNCLHGIYVRGGLPPSHKPANQVSFLTGATSNGCRLLHVTDGGRLVGEAFWYEGNWNAPAGLIELPANTSGQVSAALLQWSLDADKQAHQHPLVSAHGFHGALTIAGSTLYSNPLAAIQADGDGTNTSLLCAGTIFTNEAKGGGWDDRSTPDAQAICFGCNNKNCVKKEAQAMPDADAIRRGLTQLRTVRINLPTDLPTGVTNVKLIRVQITGGDNKDGIRIEASN